MVTMAQPNQGELQYMIQIEWNQFESICSYVACCIQDLFHGDQDQNMCSKGHQNQII